MPIHAVSLPGSMRAEEPQRISVRPTLGPAAPLRSAGFFYSCVQVLYRRGIINLVCALRAVAIYKGLAAISKKPAQYLLM